MINNKKVKKEENFPELMKRKFIEEMSKTSPGIKQFGIPLPGLSL